MVILCRSLPRQELVDSFGLCETNLNAADRLGSRVAQSAFKMDDQEEERPIVFALRGGGVESHTGTRPWISTADGIRPPRLGAVVAVADPI